MSKVMVAWCLGKVLVFGRHERGRFRVLLPGNDGDVKSFATIT